MSVYTSQTEFKRFHELLTKNAPLSFVPFYFPLEVCGKNPLPKISWKNNRKTFTEAYDLMGQGYNIAIAATEKDCLVIVDIDDLSQVENIKPTLKIRSRKRLGEHNFYFTMDKPDSDRSAKSNIPTDDAGEVRSRWQYVVAAGSYVQCSDDEISKIPKNDRENAGKYSIIEDRDVSEITFDQLPDVYKHAVYKKESDIAAREVYVQERNARKGTEKRESNSKSALWTLTIHDVTGKKDDPNYKFSSPFHGSSTFKDTSVSGGVMHCWRHLVCHSALTYLAVEAGISTCGGAGYPHGGGCSDVNFDDPYTIYTVWKYAKDAGYLPKNDPIPQQGVVYYALSKKICTTKQLIDGWKLPGYIYHIAVLVATKEGIHFGR